MDSAKQNQQRRGSLTPSSMPRTLWSTGSPTKDTQSSDSHKASVNMQVVLRCRPLTEDENRAGMPVMILCDDQRQEVTVNHNASHKQVARTFVFDKVFRPATLQTELYDSVVTPVVNELIEGYNWTIFAYGQTGTGKTYTMEGEGGKDKNGYFHKDAGVIPRVVQQIFAILEGEHVDYSVRVTYLELYNEEITDLLALDEGAKRQLVLMEDGKGSVFVRGLEEEIVCSADEIFAILEKGASRKRRATILNKSNRAHSILSITVQVKESSSGGSELIKCGKLNLVDLAGSENILRLGARDSINVAAREAGEINKSLLTLSRVVNALAGNYAHVPYRDSKLTRLLRDSLGGKAKACIIATVSPSILSQEETLSTLDFASRARNIKNRPEVNQKMMKSMLLKDLYAEINCLKQELRTTRENNGVYVPQENHPSEEATVKQLMELREINLNQQELTDELKDKLESTQRELMKTRQSLMHLEDQYQQAQETIKDKETMIFEILSSGTALTERALDLRSNLEGALSNVSTLFARIEHKNSLEDRNRFEIQKFYSQLNLQLDELDRVVSASATCQEQNLKTVQDETQSFLASKAVVTDELHKQIQTLKDLYASGVKHLDDSAEELYQNSQLGLSSLSYKLLTCSSCIAELVTKGSSDTNTISDGLKLDLNNLRSTVDAFMQQQQENEARTYEATKSISQSLLNFFKTLRIYISKLTFLEEDSHAITNQKMHAFTKRFKEFALDEEKFLVEKISELLASSRSRKENLIQAAVDDIVDGASKKHGNINQETFEMQCFAADNEEKWTNYIERTEANHVEDSVAVEAAKGTLEDCLQHCITKSTEVAEEHRAVEESLLHVLKKNAESIDSFIENGAEDSEKIRAQFSLVASSILEETEDAQKNAMLSAENLLNLDNEASNKINSATSCCIEDTKHMNNVHSEKVVEISRNARKSLVDDYLVDDSLKLSPRKGDLDLPTKGYIENLMNSWPGISLQPSQPDAVAKSNASIFQGLSGQSSAQTST